jgi:hypothetical protein
VVRTRDLGSLAAINSDRSKDDTHLIGGGAGICGLRGCWASVPGVKAQTKTAGIRNVQSCVSEIGISGMADRVLDSGLLAFDPLAAADLVAKPGETQVNFLNIELVVCRIGS